MRLGLLVSWQGWQIGLPLNQRQNDHEPQVPVLNFQDFVAADGHALYTTSPQVAAVFAKHHRVVMKAIRELCSVLPADRLDNFAQTVEMRENPSGGAMIPSRGKVVGMKAAEANEYAGGFFGFIPINR